MRKIVTFLCMFIFLAGNTYAATVTNRGTIGGLFEHFLYKLENGDVTSDIYRLKGENITDGSVTSYELADQIDIKELKVNTLNSISGNIDINSPMMLTASINPSKSNQAVNVGYVNNLLKRVRSSINNIQRSLLQIKLDILKEIREVRDITTDTNTRIKNLEKTIATGGFGNNLTVYKSDGKTKIGKFLGITPTRYLYYDKLNTGLITIEKEKMLQGVNDISYLDSNGNIKVISSVDRGFTFYADTLNTVYYGNGCDGRPLIKYGGNYTSFPKLFNKNGRKYVVTGLGGYVRRAFFVKRGNSCQKEDNQGLYTLKMREPLCGQSDCIIK